MNIPGVAMHQVAFKFECVEVQRTLECAENGSERLWAGILVRVQAEAERGKIARGDILITESAHVNRHELGELAAARRALMGEPR